MGVVDPECETPDRCECMRVVRDTNAGTLDILVTIPAAAIGMNYFKKCQVIVACSPDSLDDYIQMLGRCNRLDW